MYMYQSQNFCKRLSENKYAILALRRYQDNTCCNMLNSKNVASNSDAFDIILFSNFKKSLTIQL